MVLFQFLPGLLPGGFAAIRDSREVLFWREFGGFTTLDSFANYPIPR
jgi:hypothetical protein